MVMATTLMPFSLAKSASFNKPDDSPELEISSGTKGYIEISNYPRAMQAEVTYTASAHEERKETITAGESDLALDYEVADMQRYVEQGHDDGELQTSREVMHILTAVRGQWGMRFPDDQD